MVIGEFMEKVERRAVRVYVIENNKVVAIKYKEGNRKSGYYDIPGGKIEQGESSKQTAIREVKEETGLDISKLKNKGIMTLEYPDRIYYFDILFTNKYKGETQEFEENTSEWIDINELLKSDKVLSDTIILKQPYLKDLLNDDVNIKIYIKVDENENILDVKYGIYKK